MRTPYFIYLKAVAYILILFGIFQGLCYHFDGRSAVAILCGLVYFDLFIGSMLRQMKEK